MFDESQIYKPNTLIFKNKVLSTAVTVALIFVHFTDTRVKSIGWIKLVVELL